MKKVFLKSMLLLCALIVGSMNGWADDVYTKVTSTSDLVAGAEYVLVEGSTDTKYLANTSYSSSKYSSVTSGFSISGSNVTVNTGTAALVLRLSGNSGAWKLYDVTGEMWVGKNPSSTTNFKRTSNAADTTGSNDYRWTIKLKGSEYAIYSNSSNYTSRYWGRNSSTIAPYDGNNYPACVLYKKVYAITTTVNNGSYGTASESKGLITATPNSGYRVAAGDDGYTITTGSATVINNGNNTLTVVPTSDCTIQVNFEVIPKNKITLSDDLSVLEESAVGSGVTLPSRSSVGGFSFCGWTTSNVSLTSTEPALIIPAGEFHTLYDVLLYPVYSKDVDGIEEKTASVSISTYATDNSWVLGSNSGPRYPLVVLNDDIEASCPDNGNNGKYYGDWRIYHGDNGTVTISADNETTLKSVTFTFTVANNGCFKYGDNALTSNTAQSVSGTSATFTAGNTNNKTNGQVKITAISVKYNAPATTTYYISTPVISLSPSAETGKHYATFCAPYNTKLDAGVMAYIGTYATSTLTLHVLEDSETGTIIPANTPVVLKATSADAFDVVATTDEASDVQDETLLTANNLHGTLAATTAPANAYVLGYAADPYQETGFYSFSGTIPANRAYLIISGGAAQAAGIRIIESESNATNVENIEANDEVVKFIENGRILILRDGNTYDALGRKIR